MKTRSGFVSNSSTSSFILAFKEPQKCKCCGQTPFDFLRHMEIMGVQKETHGYFIHNTKDEIKNTKYEIEELEKDKVWLEKKIKEYKEMEDNPTTTNIANAVFKIIDAQVRQEKLYLFNCKKKVGPKKDDVPQVKPDYRAERMLEDCDDIKRSAITEEKKRMESTLKETISRIKEWEKYIDCMKKYSGNEWKVFSLKIDIHDQLYSTIRCLEEEKLIEVIKTEIT
jgi:hypothetical protein